jgi:hypothetical protein
MRAVGTSQVAFSMRLEVIHTPPTAAMPANRRPVSPMPARFTHTFMPPPDRPRAWSGGR